MHNASQKNVDAYTGRVVKLQYFKNFGCKLQFNLYKLHVSYIGRFWKTYQNNLE